MLVARAGTGLCKVLVTGVVFASVSEIAISAWMILTAIAGGHTVALFAGCSLAGM